MALPHVFLMLADDLGNYDVGFHNPLATTPNIDHLAHEGVVLERHYSYHMCGPTRAATMSGRLPFHGNQHNVNDLNSTAGVDLRMTFLPEKLKQAGYMTSMIGKSHLGARSVQHLPINRGFDQHFGFLGGGEDHYTQISGEDPVVGDLVDLWRDRQPAWGENGTFSGVLYTNEACTVIEKHAAAFPENSTTRKPLFMYLAWHLVHSPLEAPTRYWDPQCSDNHQRQLYHGMATALDEGIGNVTRALREAGMYENSLIIFYSDNGGPLVTTGLSGNNYPLRGGKTNDFEGGTRVAAFLSGGFLPTSVRGTANHAYIHAADWYSTLCGLAGVDPSDDQPGVPAIDSVDQWQTILTPNASWVHGARQEMVLAYNNLTPRHDGVGYDAAMIQKQYKIVTGHQVVGGASGFWTGPIHPNGTGPADPRRNESACGAFACCEGCLFDIQADPTEHVNLRMAQPQLFESLQKRLLELGNGTYQTDYIQPGIHCLTAVQAKLYYRGFRGPQCFERLPVVPTPPPTPAIGAFQLVNEGYCIVGEGASNRGMHVVPCGPSKSPLPNQWTISDAKTGELCESGADGLCIKMDEAEGWNCINKDQNLTHFRLG